MMSRQCSYRCFIVGAWLGLVPGIALAAPAARVEFVAGSVSATSQAGETRALAKGAEVGSGDTVNTRDGRVQLRFSDGAYISLQSQTLFRIDDYRYDGKADGSERGFFSLLKGGLRTITGLVGRTNKRNYQINTTVATIGIRGTEYTLAYGNSVSGSVGEGQIDVCNGGGCLPVGSGQSFYVAGSDVKPKITSKKTDLPPSPPSGAKPSFISGDQTTENGVPDLFILTGTHIISHATVGVPLSEDRVIGIFDSTGAASQLGGVTVQSGLDESGHSRFVSWGRGMLQGLSGGPIYGHYIAGLPTPLTDLDTLAATNIVATYKLDGGTAPTADVGGDAPFAVGKLTGGSLTADFGRRVVDANVSLTIPAPLVSTTSRIAGVTVPNATTSNPVTFQNVDITVRSQMAMSNIANPFSASTFGPNQSVAVGDCTASVGTCTFGSMNGFFTGAKASQAGVAYQVTASQVLSVSCQSSPCANVSGGNIKGAAAFAKQ